MSSPSSKRTLSTQDESNSGTINSENAQPSTSELLESDTGRCSHIASAFADDSIKSAILAKFKTVIAWNARRTQHVTHPAKRRKISAPACVDAKSGAVFCAECDDIIYDTTLDNVFLSTVISVEEKHTNFQGREAYVAWTPTEEDNAALRGTVILPCQGRRGLLNLGQTCFLNVILQSFIHNPLLRNYFLSDRHNSKLCKHAHCICCEMDKLFTEIYSPTSTPFGPTSFLATTWKVSSEMSGYAQQDAHEFFITALALIHGTCRGSTNVSCNCIIHSTFAGALQSDVTCERCGNITSTVDPMLDISLELKSKTSEAGDNTLAGCLRSQKNLGLKNIVAANVARLHTYGVTLFHDPLEANKRLSVRKLPPVLSFQFKRFEHKNMSKFSSPQKIDTPIRFPVMLNMAPYTTLVMNAKGKESEKGHDLGPDAMYEYDLFAVINHEGQMDNGHYTNFARFQDEWYRFDDDKVTQSSLGACLSSPAYMCFYVKRHLDYKPYMKPSYRLTRESDIVKEQALEREREAARMKEVDDALMAMVGGD
ncbi:hypothetical protein SERLADRAFT_415884 [Serpula lacrymans var. lacrymans S7.9]|uniref:Ubiquitin carboxyl-terminal hydrolase n=1 Tax=Serpula lacrymans var. lacrymans (strain S7.9) TaxID=578457 RepID=F8NWL2_SERL9|nr:uncharacterized protein SERLADRAFT_415884 [Serpula lacrymans var. lacrymans S7.9]EGO25037.1 hypothetical protein SERLADRAFT_415884 [Serpula lacrymans var. lacrymans S7.9]